MVGGQRGRWLTPDQTPRLYRIGLQDLGTWPDGPSVECTPLTPVQGNGTVWSGAYNYNYWLISGWGCNEPGDSNPYLFGYDGQKSVKISSQYDAQVTWRGGDVFSITPIDSYSWLLTGHADATIDRKAHLEVGWIDLYLDDDDVKYRSLTDHLPCQDTGSLFASDFDPNGLFLLGGGYEQGGDLIKYDGSQFINLEDQVRLIHGLFKPIRAIKHNGSKWLIGGEDILLEYDGANFTDLTAKMQVSLKTKFCINAIEWNNSNWVIGGGIPLADESQYDVAWLCTYDGSTIEDISMVLQDSMRKPTKIGSSVLSLAYTSEGIVIGGFADDKAKLQLGYKDISGLIGSDMTYVHWVR